MAVNNWCKLCYAPLKKVIHIIRRDSQCPRLRGKMMNVQLSSNMEPFAEMKIILAGNADVATVNVWRAIVWPACDQIRPSPTHET